MHAEFINHSVTKHYVLNYESIPRTIPVTMWLCATTSKCNIVTAVLCMSSGNLQSLQAFSIEAYTHVFMGVFFNSLRL